MLEKLTVPKSQEESIPGREAHPENINKALKKEKLGMFQKLNLGHCDRIIVTLPVFLKKKLHSQPLKVSVHKIYSQYKLYIR